MTKPLPNLPNPFLNSQVGPRGSLPGVFGARPALVVFLICLVLGLAAVGWRAMRRPNDARLRAGTEALARGAAIEVQFSQAISAAEVLGALARQSGGSIPNFQRVAADLLAVWPSLASLELQPGGVVSDIAPRAGNERAIGFNVLKDPVHQRGANAAFQKRALMVTGPLTLYRGETGMVARVPVFLRTRDGRESFWGFVAASMRLSEALGRVRMDDLFKQGYSYNLFKPASASEKAETLAAHGALSIQDAVQQPVRVHNLEFRLAVQPKGGGINKTKVVLESLAVLAVSGLLCLLVNLLESRRAMEGEIAELNQRLGRETAERKQAQEDSRGAEDEAATARAELDRARSALASAREQETRLKDSLRAAEETMQAKQAELGQACAAHQQAEQTVSSLQERLEAAAKAESEAETALQTRLKAAQATIADGELRLEGATRLAAEASMARAVPEEEAGQESSERSIEIEEAPASSPLETDQGPTPVATAEAEAPPPLEPEVSPTEAAPPPPEPPAEKKPARSGRRKKTRRNDQMDLFAAQQEPDQSEEVSTAEAKEDASTAELPLGSTVEAIMPSETATPDETKEPEKLEEAVSDKAEEAPAVSKAASEPKEEKPARALPAPPPMNHAQLRKAVNLILPLFTGQDPGAKDCLKDNRTTFRSAFSPEAYVEFEQSVKGGNFDAALEHLKKAAKRHGIPM
ncbi:MAG: CHASE domain-containing protein [Verrucomicrobia bacterium]|nr:CHASE domain-containing protein [Verrucomicrobiota bacterium]